MRRWAGGRGRRDGPGDGGSAVSLSGADRADGTGETRPVGGGASERVRDVVVPGAGPGAAEPSQLDAGQRAEGPFGALFSAEERASVLAFTEAGIERDAALRALLFSGWDAGRASDVLFEPEPQPQPEAPARDGPPGGAGSEPAGPGEGLAVDAGYLVIRAPDHQARLRGWHRCAWGTLMTRFSIPRSAWPQRRKGFYIRRYTEAAEARMHWTGQRLTLPIPEDPRPDMWGR